MGMGSLSLGAWRRAERSFANFARPQGKSTGPLQSLRIDSSDMNVTYSRSKFSEHYWYMCKDRQDSNSLHSAALQQTQNKTPCKQKATWVVFRSMLLLTAHFALRTASLADLIQFAGPLRKPYIIVYSISIRCVCVCVHLRMWICICCTCTFRFTLHYWGSTKCLRPCAADVSENLCQQNDKTYKSNMMPHNVIVHSVHISVLAWCTVPILVATSTVHTPYIIYMPYSPLRVFVYGRASDTILESSVPRNTLCQHTSTCSIGQ